MADTPWTKGPWVVARDHNGVRRIFAGYDGPQVATASVFANWMPVEQKKLAHAVADANADLIVAAPDMAAAHDENARILGYLVNELQGRIEAGKIEALNKCLQRSLAMSAKARGEQ